MTAILFIGAMLLLVYVLLIAPQRRRQQAQQRILTQVEVGDEILTAGGVYATVREVRDDDLIVEIAPGTNIRLDKRAVALVLTEEEDEEEEAEDVEEPPALEPARVADEERSQAGRS